MTAPTVWNTLGRPLRTVDLRWYGTDYRLAEYVRNEASIRPADVPTPCSTCVRVPSGASQIVIGDGWTACPSCAIWAGVLEPLDPEAAVKRTGIRKQRRGRKP